MKEKNVMVAIQPHQLTCRGDRLIDHRLEQGSTVPYFQDGQTRIIEIHDGAAGLFADFSREDTGTGVEIVNHVLESLNERQRYPVTLKRANYTCSSTSATPPEMANFIASAELISVSTLTLSRITK